MLPFDVSKEEFEKKIAELEGEIKNDEFWFCFIIALIIVGVSTAAFLWGRV